MTIKSRLTNLVLSDEFSKSVRFLYLFHFNLSVFSRVVVVVGVLGEKERTIANDA